MAGDPLSIQVMQALARGDKQGALRLMRDAGGPALRRVMAEIQAQARAQQATMQASHQAATRVEVGDGGHQQRQAQSARVLERKRPPTVQMGDPPGSLRWLLVAVLLLLAGWWLAPALG